MGTETKVIKSHAVKKQYIKNGHLIRDALLMLPELNLNNNNHCYCIQIMMQQ